MTEELDPRDPWAAARGDPWYALRQRELEEKVRKGETLEPKEKFEYMNLPRTPSISPEAILTALVVLKLSRTEKGLEVIKVLGKEFLKGIFDTMHALGQASAANQVVAWANPYLVMMVLDRFGFVAGPSVGEFKLGLSIITGAEIAEGFADTIQGFFPFSSPEPSEFPSSIAYSARTEGDVTTEELKAEGITLEDVKALKKLKEK